MHYRPALVAGHDLTVDVAHESADRLDSLRWRLSASDHGAVAIAEHAVERVDPGASRTVPQCVGARRVSRNHSAERAEISTRRIDRKPEAFSSRRDVQCCPENAGFDPDCLVAFVNSAEVVDTGEINDDARPDCSAGHAAAGSARNERGA